MAAFRAALDAGVGIECDVRLSRDHVPILFHDPSLERLCGTKVETGSLNAAALMRFRLNGSAERIPWLGDLLALVDGAVPLLLELKADAGPFHSPIDHLCAATLRAIEGYGGAVGVMSFDPLAVAWFTRHAPQVRRGLVIADSISGFRRWAAMSIATPHFLAIDRAALGRQWVARARRDLLVGSWTIRSAAERAQAEPLADVLIWEADGRPRP